MQITGIILAGGKSTRMGTDKALLKVGDRTLLENAIEICKPVCNSIIISSNNPLHKFGNYPLVSDEIPDCGPMGGIYSSLKKSITKWNFIISVDTPNVSKDFILFLKENIEQKKVIVPVHDGKIEPLLAMYNKNCLDELGDCISMKRFSLVKFLDGVNTKFVNSEIWLENNSQFFKNLNYPEDKVF